MLQNRVDPLGHIIKTSARGAWMGNRGQLHDEHKNIQRAFKLKAWIICVLEFKGRKRKVMSPGLYTELFFLDEATAFAAGHRPCFECRRKDAALFKTCWIKGNPSFEFHEKTSIQKIDAVLHKERVDNKNNKITYEEGLKNLPDGSFILHDDKPFLLVNNFIFEWTPSGYINKIKLSTSKKVQVLTPRSIVNAFKAGYRPQGGIES